MFKKASLFLIFLFISCSIPLLSGNGAVLDLFHGLFATDELEFCCPQEQLHYYYMKAWCRSDEAIKLRNDRAIEVHDLALHCFLHGFVTDSHVKNLLARRVHIDFKGRKAVAFKEYKELIDLMVTVDERARIRTWLEEFKELLATWGATIHQNPAHADHAEPGRIWFSFDRFPGYMVKCLVWNYYPLGFYDAAGSYSCLVPHCQISAYPFSLQLVSSVSYAEEIKQFVRAQKITNVEAQEKWLYIFPWAADEPLDDKNLFVVEERFAGKAEEQNELLQNLSCGAVTDELLRQKASDPNDYSILANVTRVILHSGVWSFAPKVRNFALLRNTARCDDLVAVLIDIDRPAFGGSNPFNFFHKKNHDFVLSEEVVSNGRIGLSSFSRLLNDLHTEGKAKKEGAIAQLLQI